MEPETEIIKENAQPITNPQNIVNQGHNIKIPSTARHVLLSDASNLIMLTKISPLKIAPSYRFINSGKSRIGNTIT